MDTKKSLGKRRLRNDLILIGAFLLIAGIGILYLFVLRDGGDTVKVTLDGKLYGTYSLKENIKVDIKSGEDGSNVLIIENGRVYVESASCPDGICVGHRPIFRDGESIICLPNRVVITVVKNNGSDSPDVAA